MSSSLIGGKTTLLNAILGELNKLNGLINMHRAIENGFAYVRLIFRLVDFCLILFFVFLYSQESWIQQISFRDNILFGTMYYEQWYKNVVNACALENDIQVSKSKR